MYYKLLINCKMAPAYHCKENGTFMEGLYIRSYKNGKEFEDIDVSKDEKQLQKMIKDSGQMGVPVVDIDGEVIIGFDKEKIDKLLNINQA